MTAATYMNPERALARLDEADKALALTMSKLDEHALRGPSLLPGWSRAHVLAHLARNADALQRLVGWASTGREVSAYDSLEQRDADIEHGAQQGLARLRADVTTSSAAFRQRVEHLRGRTDLADVRTGSTNVVLNGSQIPWMRLREVTVHHVDLDAGYDFGDAPREFLHAAIMEAVDRLNGRVGCPPVTLVGSDGRHANLGGGGQAVSGNPGQLLLWLLRGIDSGLESHKPLPSLPSFG
jgi:maleylpyruvate isomerase